MTDSLKTEYFDCICHSPEHIVRFVLDDDPDFPELYFEAQLNNNLSFWKRLKFGLRYIMGFHGVGYYWDGWSLSVKDAERLGELVGKFTGIKRKQS